MTKLQELKVAVDMACDLEKVNMGNNPWYQDDLKKWGLDARIGNFGIVFLDSQPGIKPDVPTGWVQNPEWEKAYPLKLPSADDYKPVNIGATPKKPTP